MEEIKEDPSQISRNLYTNKRKFQHGISDSPLPKHACLEKNSTPESCFPSNIHSDYEGLRSGIKERSSDNIHSRYDQIDEWSAKDSNSFFEDEDSVMSVSNGSKTKMQYLKSSPYDHRSTSSVNWGGRFVDTSVNSLDRFDTKTCDEISMNPTYSLYESASFEDQQIDYGNSVECDSSEYKNSGSKECEDEELEDFVYSNGVVPKDFVLSSGRWNVNQDTQQGKEKLTIDKEFEQYFSMLML